MGRNLGTRLATGTLAGLALTILVQAGAAGAALADPPAPIDTGAAKARLAERLRRLVAEDGFEGVVRIDVRDETLLRAGVGLADPVTHRPFTPDTQVEMGSIGKSFTAAAILKLRDAGRLSLDDTLGKFLPAAPADKRGITLRQLLTHTAGLPMYPAAEDGSPGADKDAAPIDRAAFERRLFAGPLIAAPGTRFQYSNVGYGVLADIIERISRRSYEDYLTAEILRPGGAVHTGYRTAYRRDSAETSRDGQAIEDVAWGAGGPYWGIQGSGGLVTTVDDMIAWRKAFLAGRVVKPASVAEATTGGVEEGPGRPERYGFGVGLQQHPLYGRMIWHNGGDNWFTSDFRQMPEAGVTLFVATNSRENATSAATKLSRALFGAPDGPAAPQGMPAERALVEGFVAALADADPTHRRAFLDARAGPVFVEREGLPKIEQSFTGLHDRIAGRTFEGAQFGSPGHVILTFAGSGAPPRLLIELQLGGSPEAPRVAGFGVSPP